MNNQDYQVPFRFDDKINKLTFNLGPVQLTEEDHRKMREAGCKARDEDRTSSGWIGGTASSGAAKHTSAYFQRRLSYST